MNRNFDDARYYLKRAGETAKAGMKEELQDVQDRFNELTGNGDDDPEGSRLEKVQQRVEELEKEAEGEARRALTSAKGRISDIRNSRKD